MSEKTNNRWLTDIKGKVNPVLAAYSSGDLPTYLVIGGKRIPLVVTEVKGVDGASPDCPELEIHIDSSGVADTEWIVEAEGALGAILHAEEKLQHAKDRLVALRQVMETSAQKPDSKEAKDMSVQENNEELIAITKVYGKYICARRYGI